MNLRNPLNLLKIRVSVAEYFRIHRPGSATGIHRRSLTRLPEHEPGKRLVAVKNVTVNEDFFQGHFPGSPLMPWASS